MCSGLTRRKAGAQSHGSTASPARDVRIAGLPHRGVPRVSRSAAGCALSPSVRRPWTGDGCDPYGSSSFRFFIPFRMFVFVYAIRRGGPRPTNEDGALCRAWRGSGGGKVRQFHPCRRVFCMRRSLRLRTVVRRAGAGHDRLPCACDGSGAGSGRVWRGIDGHGIQRCGVDGDGIDRHRVERRGSSEAPGG